MLAEARTAVIRTVFPRNDFEYRLVLAIVGFCLLAGCAGAWLGLAFPILKTPRDTAGLAIPGATVSAEPTPNPVQATSRAPARPTVRTPVQIPPAPATALPPVATVTPPTTSSSPPSSPPVTGIDLFR